MTDAVATAPDGFPVAPPGRSGWPWDSPAVGPVVAPDLPRISIVTPNLNGSAFLEEAIRSVLGQGYPHLELLVMDGGSDDGSAEIIRRYERWLAGWVSEPDRGQSAALNRGLDRASGEVLGWLCSDDLLQPGALLAVGEYFRAHRGCRWLSGHGDFVWAETGRRWAGRAGLASRGALVEFWQYGHPGHFIPQASCFFAASLWRDVGGVREDLHYAMDYDLWLRMEERAELEVVDRTLSVARLHPAAKTVAHARLQDEVMMACAFDAVRRRGGRRVDLLARMLAWAVLWRLARLSGCVRAGALRSALRELAGAVLAVPRVATTRGRIALAEANRR